LQVFSNSGKLTRLFFDDLAVQRYLGLLIVEHLIKTRLNQEIPDTTNKLLKDQSTGRLTNQNKQLPVLVNVKKFFALLQNITMFQWDFRTAVQTSVAEPIIELEPKFQKPEQEPETMNWQLWLCF